MPYYFFVWTPKTIAHLAEHDVTSEEFEEVVSNPDFHDVSRTSGNPLAIGSTFEGRRLCCVFQIIAPDTIEPVTAFELSE